VAIVTAVGPAGPIGTTVTSVRSLSATPPLLAVSLNRTVSVWPGLAAAPRFLVHLLGATQAPLAERFATSGVDRFAAPTRWSTDGAGLPRLADVAVVLTCEKTHQLPFGEADLLVARIVGVEHGPADGPLLHSDGAYHRLSAKPLS
jgi:flavin reductase (DIM6/NTAB) family NADH-FMN oxidoreductase RutF